MFVVFLVMLILALCSMGRISDKIATIWRKLPPGVCIAMMGLLAALYPILTHDPISPQEKSLWISGFLALMAVEMTVIFKERARQDRAFIAQMEQLEGNRRLYDAHGLALERVRTSLNKGSLRDRAFRLSESILEFI